MLFVGNDWAEAHHDVELVDQAGVVLARRRLPEGVVGLATLHALIADHLGEGDEPDQVLVGIETDRGPVGASADRGRLHRVSDQPAAGVSLPRTPRRGRSEV